LIRTRAPIGADEWTWSARADRQFVPGGAAAIDEIIVQFKDLKTRLESQLPRMNSQMFSTGLSSGHFGGSGPMGDVGRHDNATEFPSLSSPRIAAVWPRWRGIPAHLTSMSGGPKSSC